MQNHKKNHNCGKSCIPCHGVVCHIVMSCDVCRAKICGVACTGLLGRTITGLVLMCGACFYYDTTKYKSIVKTND